MQNMHRAFFVPTPLLRLHTFAKKIYCMFDFSHLLFDKLVIHRVGAKSLDEGYFASEAEHDLLDDQLQVVLFDYFFASFKSEDQFRS